MDGLTPFEFERLITETTMVLDEQLSLEHEQFEKAAEENLIFNMTLAEENVITERLLMKICRGNLPEGSPHFKIAMDSLKDVATRSNTQVSNDEREDAGSESNLADDDTESHVKTEGNSDSKATTEDYEINVEIKHDEKQTNDVSSREIKHVGEQANAVSSGEIKHEEKQTNAVSSGEIKLEENQTNAVSSGEIKHEENQTNAVSSGEIKLEENQTNAVSSGEIKHEGEQTNAVSSGEIKHEEEQINAVSSGEINCEFIDTS